MKFSKILLTGIEAVHLPIFGARPSDSFILKHVDGLGSSEVDVLITTTASQGGTYQGRRPQNKEIVLRIGLNPNYPGELLPDDLRTMLYGLLTPAFDGSMLVHLLDSGENIVATIDGYIKRIEPVLFTKEPEVQVTVACLQPYFRTPNTHGLYDDDKSAPKFNCDGTAPSGIHMEIQFTASLGSWYLMDEVGRRMNFVHPFVNGDFLRFDTRPGHRFVSLNGVGALGLLDATSKWLMLHRGINNFTTSSPSFGWSTTYFSPLYWGV